jgi:hypothetical protein
MKKILILALLVVMLLCFASCAKLTSEEVIEVEAIITEVDRDPMRLVGKVVYPADYDIYFEYDGIKGSWDVNKNTYNLYKDKVGETIKCNLFIHTYDDGTIRKVLKIKEGENK